MKRQQIVCGMRTSDSENPYIKAYHVLSAGARRLVIAKIFAYILTRDYSSSNYLKKKAKSLKISGNRCWKLDLL